jgi:PHD/YefM family antitoxin component YafN of YafNO toxin-antitoxin module
MKTLTISTARKHLTSLDTTAPVAVSRKGQPVMIIVSPQLWEKAIDALEEIADTSAYDRAIATDEALTPWQDLIAEIGWSPEQATAEEIAEARRWLGLPK